MAERGAKIVAVADHTGGVCAEAGLDAPALAAWVAEHGGVKGFPSGDTFDGAEIVTWNADVLVPAALEDAIHKDNAADVKARIIVEGANGPTTPEASDILDDMGVLVTARPAWRDNTSRRNCRFEPVAPVTFRRGPRAANSAGQSWVVAGLSSYVLLRLPRLC